MILLFFFSSPVFSDEIGSKADTIIIKTLNSRVFYESYVDEYDADVYIKGNARVMQKNLLYQYAPDFLYLDRRGGDSFVESLLNVQFKAPNHFVQQIKAINGPKIFTSDIEERVVQFLNVNIYNPTLFNNHLLLPDAKDVFRYYRFEYVECIDTLGFIVHKIRCKPEVKSQKLINGYFYIVDKYWTILRFEIQGKIHFSNYWVETDFGLPNEEHFLLPQKTHVSFRLNLLGNETISNYHSFFHYRSVTKGHVDNFPKPGYDLSDYFNLPVDSIPYIEDESFWEEKRSVPLTPDEKRLIESNRNPGSSIDTTFRRFHTYNMARGTIAPKRILTDNMSFSYSGLINPLKLAYSKLDGIVYWQQFRFRRTWKSGQELRFDPNVGFLFKNKEVYFRAPLSWTFDPGRFGKLNVNFGNKNHNYGYRVQNLINEEVPDSLSFEDFNLDYFHHYDFKVNGNYEIANGLLVNGGVDFSLYVPVRSKNFGKTNDPRADFEEDVVDIIRDHYRTFSPFLGLTWTPGQYYRYIGKRKEYVRSKFPTFSAEYARGMKDVFDSNSYYERVELDVQQKIPVGLLRSFQYYIAAGKFTNTRSFYFADFSLFQKQNLPESWDDPLGGVFHLLRGKWYNASDAYVQAHFMYESPFVVFQFFRGITKDIVKERVYVSQLYSSAQASYTELGYAVGNFLGNAGVFVSLERGKFEGVGAKFSFELGR